MTHSPSQTLIDSLKHADEYPATVFSDLVATVCSTLEGNLDDSVAELALTHDLNVKELQICAKCIQYFIQNARTSSLNLDGMTSDLQSFGLSDSRSKLIAQQIEKLRDQSKTDSSAERLTDVNQLIDMEWKFGVTAASSELDKVGSTFLQLKLVSAKPGQPMTNSYMELSLPQFYQFLHELERAKASLEYLV